MKMKLTTTVMSINFNNEFWSTIIWPRKFTRYSIYNARRLTAQLALQAELEGLQEQGKL